MLYFGVGMSPPLQEPCKLAQAGTSGQNSMYWRPRARKIRYAIQPALTSRPQSVHVCRSQRWSISASFSMVRTQPGLPFDKRSINRKSWSSERLTEGDRRIALLA